MFVVVIPGGAFQDRIVGPFPTQAKAVKWNAEDGSYGHIQKLEKPEKPEKKPKAPEPDPFDMPAPARQAWSHILPEDFEPSGSWHSHYPEND